MFKSTVCIIQVYGPGRYFMGASMCSVHPLGSRMKALEGLSRLA